MLSHQRAPLGTTLRVREQPATMFGTVQGLRYALEVLPKPFFYLCSGEAVTTLQMHSNQAVGILNPFASVVSDVLGNIPVPTLYSYSLALLSVLPCTTQNPSPRTGWGAAQNFVASPSEAR